MSDVAVDMDREEIDSFLGTGGTGVISLSTDASEPPHSVPVSYGYDATDGAFYFRLATGSDSEKSDLAGRPVTFVAYGSSEDRWHSVVARGRLRDIEDGDTQEALAGLQRVHIPLFDVFDRPPADVTFEVLRLEPDKLTGRSEGTAGE